MSANRNVLIVPTGLANISSLLAAIKRLGFNGRLLESISAIDSANYLVLPGVGAFGAGMKKLNELGIQSALKKRIEEGKATLAVCLGMQLLFNSSEESPGVKGLGILPGVVKKLPKEVRVPQLGWNKVIPDSTSRLLEPGFAYFANSYALREQPEGYSVSVTTHGEQIISAIEKGKFLACQFHPELSGPWGEGILRRWLELGRE